MAPVLHPAEPSPAEGGRSDEELLAAHLAGDRDAFAHLIRRHQTRLWSVALRTLRDPEEASDAVQDALVCAYRRASSFRGQAQVGTWLHRIVVNACLDRIRRRRPTGQLPTEWPEDDLDPRAEVSDPYAQLDDRLALQRALDGLSEAQRLAVLLVDVEQLSVKEAARELEVAEGTVKSRCARARASLAATLRPQPGEPTASGERPTDRPPSSPRPAGGDPDA